MTTDDILPIDLNIQDNNIIKVMGVGGGGCNAVNYMYHQGINDVSFLVCNTDRQALELMQVPAKLQIGPGLGAGGDPVKAKAYAEENRERIREALDDGTKMLFLTAGMGGGTGTGATPIVAEVAQELGILTVAIVTIPFRFEGERIITKALKGAARLGKRVDAILIINNERLCEVFPDFDLPNAFEKSNIVLSDAAKAIAEIITNPGYINTDFADVHKTLVNGGMAILNVGRASGEERITKAIENALNSPLINTNDVYGASRIMLQLYCSKEKAVCMKELEQINRFIDSVGKSVDVKWGVAYDDTLEEDVRVTIIATGYSMSNIPCIDEEEEAENMTTVAEPEKKNNVTIDQAIDIFYGKEMAGKKEKNAPPHIDDKPEQASDDSKTDETQEKGESAGLTDDIEVIDFDKVKFDDEEEEWLRK